MGRADYFAEGDWNVSCDWCGKKRKASQCRKDWQGFLVCYPEHWRPREQQDFVGKPPAETPPPFTRPWSERPILVCTPNGQSAVPGDSIPGCVSPGYLHPAYTKEL